MANKRKYHHPKDRIMGRSDVPLAERMRYQHSLRIARERERAAMLATYATSVALYDVKGVGYRRLIRYGKRYMEYEREFYADGVEVGLARAKRRLDELGMEVSGDLYACPDMGGTARDQDVRQHAMSAIQVSLIVSHMAIHDEFGYGAETLTLIANRVEEIAAIYAKRGMKFLLEEMEEIGFEIRNGRAQYYLDEQDNVITKTQAAKMEAAAKKKELNHA